MNKRIKGMSPNLGGTMEIFENISWFLAGVGIFLIGMKIIGENLENTA